MIKEWCEQCNGLGGIDKYKEWKCTNCHGKGYTELEPDGEIEIVEHFIEVNGVYEPTSELTIDYEGDMTVFKTVDEAIKWAKRHNFKIAHIFDLKEKGKPKHIVKELEESKE